MKLGVPSGIGDISWVVSKLVSTPEWSDGMEIEIADGWPFRAKPYMDMLGVKSSYGEFSYEDIISFENRHPYRTWDDLRKRGYGVDYIQPNHHLERGLPLVEWLPDLPTEYHYPMHIPELSKRLKIISACLSEGNWVGISCASYRGANAWKTWELSEWTELASLLTKSGWRICLLGGGWDDLTDALLYEIEDGLAINLVGKTEFGEACAIHQSLRGYIGFSSGLGIIRSVMGLPTLMLWPSHQQALSTSWADPEDLKSGKYIARPYVEPKTIAQTFLRQMKEMEGVR